jgi:3-oxoadipate enol-lactonase
MPFDVSKLHTVRAGGGPGPLLVFSHALGLDHEMWAPVVEALAAQHPMLLYDHRGHGSSGYGGGAWSLDDLVEDAAALIRAQADAPVVFVGLSMGGMVAQGLAVRHPDLLRGVVLAHTVSGYGDAARQAWAQRVETVRTSGMEAVVDTVVARYLGRDFLTDHPQVGEALRATLLVNDSMSYAASCEAVAQVDWRASLPAVRCPTLVIAGRHDLGAPVEEAQRIAAAIPDARLEILEHSAHLSPIEEPLALVAALEQFLNTLP